MSDKGLSSLLQPVRRAVLIPYLGQIGIALAALASLPLLVSGLTGDTDAFWRYALVILLLLGMAIPASRQARPAELQPNEGLVIIAAVFVLSPLLMAFPLSSAGLGYGQALFEAVSAVTTTGLSTLDSIADKPDSFLFARAWMQWYGGLGIVALLPLWMEPGPTARQFIGMDQPEVGDPLTSARFYARRILGVYLGLTAGGILLLWLLGADPFSALVHTLSAVSTGGFSSYENSLADASRPVAMGVTLLCLLGALPFVIYLQAIHDRFRHLPDDPQLRGLPVLLLLGFVALFLLLQNTGMEWTTALFHAGMLAASAQTTAGFSTLDPATLSTGAKYLLILMMATGGSLGSTAGGIKFIRLLILFQLLRLLIERTALPRDAWITARVNGRQLDSNLTVRALLMILLFALTILLSWLPFLAAGLPPLDALFEIVSAVGTVGLSVGITRPDLPPLLQGILCLDMWLGRLEILALLVLFSPTTWRHHKEVAT